MSRKDNDWFLSERAQAMAIVHLTRRPDLVISDARKDDTGLDLLVRITKDHARLSIRQFGIVLRGSMKATTEGRLSKATITPPVPDKSEYPYPVCLFFFTMEDNQGYFAWLAEPIVTEDGAFRLLTNSELQFHRLDRAALDAIVDRVDAWYDAFYATVVGASA